MPRKLSNALTAIAVAKAKTGKHVDGHGLFLLVKPTGAKSWVLRYTVSGKTREMGLGPADGVNAVTLAKARELASARRLQVSSGVDPLAEREVKAAAAVAEAQAAKIAGITFKASAEAYIAAHEASWRNAKHRYQWGQSLASYAYPIIGDIPIADIETEHVTSVLEPIWHSKQETASRLRGRLELILDSAKVRGHRQGENPARWRGHISAILPARSKLSRGHHKALPYVDVPAFMTTLQGNSTIAAMALEFTILSACRTGEVIGATWGEIDIKNAVWTIPAGRMKAAKEHRVPLTGRMVEILETMQPMGTDAVFSGNKGKPLSNMAMMMLLRRMGHAEITVHGFRSAFRDWAAESTGFAHEVCEMALAHAIASAVEASYRRGDLFDKRRKLMDAWATYCAAPVAEAANVTPIRGAA